MNDFKPIEKVSFMWFTKEGTSEKLGYRDVNAQAIDFFVKKLVHECKVPTKDIIQLLETKLIPELKQYTQYQQKQPKLLKKIDFMRPTWKTEINNLIKIKRKVN